MLDFSEWNKPMCSLIHQKESLPREGLYLQKEWIGLEMAFYEWIILKNFSAPPLV